MYDNHKQLLKKEEDNDGHGNQGMFIMKSEFNIVILSNMGDKDFDDEILQMQMDCVDHIDDFYKIYVRAPEEW